MKCHHQIGISVIIPTACEKVRHERLWRAIHSVLSQQDVVVELIIVVNGNRVDEELYRALEAHGRLKVVYQEVGSLPAAQRHGRSLVGNEYFTLLDDDDELLPGALKARAEPLETDTTVDVVVSNGYITYDGHRDELHVQNFTLARSDPLLELMRSNWLASCGGLFRSQTISVNFFDGKTKYYEWTLLAVRLVLANKKLTFLESLTFRVHRETAYSLSKSTAYRDSSIGFLKTLLTFDMPPPVKKEVKKKIGRLMHSRSDEYRGKGELGKAWKYHISSMNYPGSWKYVLYIRKLLFIKRLNNYS